MGCYDTVHFQCPRYKATIPVQSKAGNCTLCDFDADAVPVAIAADLRLEHV